MDIEENEKDQMCSVCYIKLEVKNSVITPCNHFFCSVCFFRWLLTNNNCPMCRAEIFNREVTDENLSKYSRDMLSLLIKGENIVKKNIKIFNNNKKLLEENEKLKELHSDELRLTGILSNKIKKLQKERKRLLREIRILKIKKINEKNKNLKISDILDI